MITTSFDTNSPPSGRARDTPTRPETGYGYIRVGEPLGGRAYRVRAFVEKPPLADAQRFVASGEYLWNSGMFAWRVDALLATSEEVAEAATVRFPGRYELVPQGIDPELFAPVEKKQLVVMEWRQTERPLLRALVRAQDACRDSRPGGGRRMRRAVLRGRHAVGAAEARRERADAGQADREADVGDRVVGAPQERGEQSAPFGDAHPEVTQRPA